MLLWNSCGSTAAQGERARVTVVLLFQTSGALTNSAALPFSREDSAGKLVPKLKITQLLLISEAQKCTKPSPYQVFYHKF